MAANPALKDGACAARIPVNGRSDHFLRVIFFARYKLPVIGADSYDDARAKVAEALKGAGNR